MTFTLSSLNCSTPNKFGAMDRNSPEFKDKMRILLLANRGITIASIRRNGADHVAWHDNNGKPVTNETRLTRINDELKKYQNQ